MYKAFVRSHLDYCDFIYHIPSLLNQAPLCVTLNSLMELNNNQPLPFVGLGMVQTVPNSTRKLGLESLSDRRMGRRILQIHKIVNNKYSFLPK